MPALECFRRSWEAPQPLEPSVGRAAEKGVRSDKDVRQRLHLWARLACATLLLAWEDGSMRAMTKVPWRYRPLVRRLVTFAAIFIGLWLMAQVALAWD